MTTALLLGATVAGVFHAGAHAGPPAATEPQVTSPDSVLTDADRAALKRAVAEAKQYRKSFFTASRSQPNLRWKLAMREWGTLEDQPYAHIRRGPETRRWLTLTFDDGPDPKVTPQVLKVLKQMKVRATFFVIGKKAVQHPALIRQMVAEGHTVANHTYDHLYLPRISRESARVELEACSKVIEAITGSRPRYYRPPGGHYDRQLVETGKSLGLKLVLWTSSVGDWAKPPTRDMILQALMQTRPGGLLIWHDDIPSTPGAVRIYIQAARARGFKFVPLEAYEPKPPSSEAFNPSATGRS